MHIRGWFPEAVVVVLCVIATRGAVAQTYELLVSSYATNSIMRYEGMTGAFIDALVPSGAGGLSSPQGLTIGPDGNLYVCSAKPRQVLRFDGTTGGFLGSFIPPGTGGMGVPHDLVFGPDGNLYVTSANTAQVLLYDGSTGDFIDVFASGGGLVDAHGLIFGPDGHLYVAGRTGGNVLRYDGTTGEALPSPGNDGATFVQPGSGGLAHAVGLVFDRDGNLLVCSWGSDEVLKFDGATGDFLVAFATGDGLSHPGDIVYGPDGTLYVTNSGNGCTVRIHDPATGSYLGDFVPCGSGGLNGPTYLAFRQVETFRRGDSDADRNLNLTDAIFTLTALFLAGPQPDCQDSADADDDGSINITDVIYTLNFLFLAGTPPPAPGPVTCGPDPTGDALSPCGSGRC